MRAFLAGLADDELARSVQLTDRQGTTHSFAIWHMLMHLILHSMQHRSEAAAILTKVGQSPGDLDFLTLDAAQRETAVALGFRAPI